MGSRKKDVRPWGWAVLAAVCAGGVATGQDPQWRRMAPPDVRREHAVAFDTVRNCTVLFGGEGDRRFLADTWELHGTEWRHVPTAVAPPARRVHAMAYDPVRGVVVLFGGTGNSGLLADTWEYDGATWTQVTTPTSPSARNGHAMVHDVPSAGIVLFGGQGGAFMDDTWVYGGNPPTWTQVQTSGSPSPRKFCAMAHDPVRGRTVMFGGLIWFDRLGDTWEYDGLQRTWTQTQSGGPPARSDSAMAYHGNLGVLLFGGRGAGGRLADTWLYTGTWTQRLPPTSPPARNVHAMAFDTVHNWTVVFGGAPMWRNDTWTFDGTTWTQRAVAPPARAGAGVAYDGPSRRVLVFGGQDFPATMTDTWELDGSTWSQIQTSTSPPGRIWRPMAYDSRRARVVVFGGAEVNRGNWTFFDDTWEFDTIRRTWAHVPTTRAPSPRCNYSMAYDARRGVVVLFGGFAGGPGSFFDSDDTWEYDGVNWTRRPTANAPSPRTSGVAYDARRGVVVLFGGAVVDLSGNPRGLGETWEYDGVDWTRVVPVLGNPEPHPRWGTLAYDSARGRIRLFGGVTSSGGFALLDDTWEYDGSTWTQVSVPFDPPPRGTAGLAYDPAHDRTVMVYGSDLGGRGTGGICEFHAASVPTWSRYGFGCAGGNGLTPLLDAAPGSVPALGGVFTLEFTNLTPVASAFILGFGTDIGQFGGLPLDLGLFGMPGCDLWVGFEPGLTVVGAHTGSSRQLSFPIPNDPNLDGRRFAMQALCFDALAPNGCAALSNAGIATIH